MAYKVIKILNEVNSVGEVWLAQYSNHQPLKLYLNALPAFESICILMDRIRNTILPLFYWLVDVWLKGMLLQQLASVNINQTPALLCVSPPPLAQSLDQWGRASRRPSVNQPARFPLALQMDSFIDFTGVAERWSGQVIMSMLKREWRKTLRDKWLGRDGAKGKCKIVLAVKMEEFWDEKIYKVNTVAKVLPDGEARILQISVLSFFVVRKVGCITLSGEVFHT